MTRRIEEVLSNPGNSLRLEGDAHGLVIVLNSNKVRRREKESRIALLPRLERPQLRVSEFLGPGGGSFKIERGTFSVELLLYWQEREASVFKAERRGLLRAAFAR